MVRDVTFAISPNSCELLLRFFSSTRSSAFSTRAVIVMGHRSFHHCGGQNDAPPELRFLVFRPSIETGYEMARLQKFIEQGADGVEPGRTAYAFIQDKLPPPDENLEWKAVPSFNAADEVMRDPGLKELFMKAIEDGYAIVAPPSAD